MANEFVAKNGLISQNNTTITGSLTLSGSGTVIGALAIGTSSLGPNENTLTLGARDVSNEGGQLGFNAPGGTYTSASYLDLYQNRFRILRGTNASSIGEAASWNLGTLQAALPAYTSATSFPGTSVSVLGTDSGGNILTLGAWQDYTLSTNLIGITSPTNKQIQYMVLGKTMFVQVDFRCASPNGSGSSTSFTVPFNASSWSGEQRGLIQGVNNLTQVSSLWRIVAGTNVVDVSATTANDTTYNGWTNATARRVVGFLMINIA
jgi:hypothetical protein